MQIKSLKINNLRNIQAAEIDPHPAFNVLHGDNGAGKTSVLEALVVLAKGKSFRSGNIAALIGPAGDQLRVVAEVTRTNGQLARVGVERSATDWKARIDGSEVQKISELATLLPLVMLEPNSHLMVSGPPEGRRKFLDWGVFHVKHGHLDTWRRYSRALKQRNAALKLGRAELVRSLDPLLIEYGGLIHCQREEQMVQIMEALRLALRQLSPELAPVELIYEPGWSGDSLAEHLAVSLERDFERGSTQAGPHRADIAIRSAGRLARERFSRGEQKLLAGALLLAQAQVMNAAGNVPLLLLDDLASEFDRFHLGNMLEAGQALASQIWLTGVSTAPLEKIGLPEHRMFHVKQGQISAG